MFEIRFTLKTDLNEKNTENDKLEKLSIKSYLKPYIKMDKKL